MAQPQSVEAATASPVFEGTWDELLRHSQEFAGKRLRLTILAEEKQPDTSQQARIAAIDAVFGKYAHLGVSVDELHRDRQADKLKETLAATVSGV